MMEKWGDATSAWEIGEEMGECDVGEKKEVHAWFPHFAGDSRA